MSRLSPFRVLITLLDLVFLTILFHALIGWWCLLAGHVVTLYSARPVPGDDRWLWEVRS